MHKDGDRGPPLLFVEIDRITWSAKRGVTPLGQGELHSGGSPECGKM